MESKFESLRVGGAWVGDVDEESGLPKISATLNDGSKIWLYPVRPEYRKNPKSPQYQVKMEAGRARELGLEYRPDGQGQNPSANQAPPPSGLGF